MVVPGIFDKNFSRRELPEPAAQGSFAAVATLSVLPSLVGTGLCGLPASPLINPDSSLLLSLYQAAGLYADLPKELTTKLTKRLAEIGFNRQLPPELAIAHARQCGIAAAKGLQLPRLSSFLKKTEITPKTKSRPGNSTERRVRRRQLLESLSRPDAACPSHYNFHQKSPQTP